MNLTGIIAISGKPGLYKVIAQGKNNIIVESIEDKKRTPAYSSDRISALDDISIYTTDGDSPLKEIFVSIFTKENGKETLSHKEDSAKLKKYLLEVLPNFDQERVYGSDIKKVFQWYNSLLKAGVLVLEEKEEKPAKKTAKKADAESTEDKTEKANKPAAKTTAAKKTPAVKKADSKMAGPKASAKTSAAKKVAAPKTGSSRGK
jgi:hypothetical protein